MLLRHLLFVLVLTPAVHGQTVHFVDAGATGANTGVSWADAFTDLQSALTTAQSGDEVWVAEGTYRPTSGSARTATFQLRSGVALYGGFGGSETERNQRDWVLHPTVLSGDIGTPAVKIDNVYHVVTGSGTDSTALLDGFTITAAYADGPSPRNRGGGMRNVAGSPTVRHCIFRANEARNSSLASIGAGMFNDQGSSPRLDSVRFERNISERQSAGLGNRNGSSPILSRVVFMENEAGVLGGGMTNESGSTPVLIDVQFIRNRSGGWTGGLDNYQASPTLYNVRFYGNVCANYGCGMTNDTNANALVSNAVFVGNVALDGPEDGAGALQNNGSSPTLVGVSFVANSAPSGSADALGHRGGGNVTIRDAMFWGNGAELVDEAGGALDVSHAVVQGGFAEGTAVLDADPLFVRPPSAGPDVTWGTPDDDYGDLRVRPTSPAIDAGDAAHLLPDAADLDGDGDTSEPLPVDIEGRPRVLGRTLDLGAYEGGIAVSTDPTRPGLGIDVGRAYPNPARGPVTIPFTLAAPAPVTLRLLDALGRQIATLLDAPLPSGTHSATLQTDRLAPGLYFVVLETGAFSATRSVVVVS